MLFNNATFVFVSQEKGFDNDASGGRGRRWLRDLLLSNFSKMLCNFANSHVLENNRNFNIKFGILVVILFIITLLRRNHHAKC